jgi:sugar phosphate isomerase/epimerase
MLRSKNYSRRQILNAFAATGAAAALLELRESAADQTPPVDRWQIGCFTRPWKDEPYTTAFEEIAEAGFKYVGFMTAKVPGGYFLTAKTPPDDAAKAGTEATKRGLRVLAAWGGGLPVQNSVADGVAALRQLIDNANLAGVATLLMGGTGKESEYDAYYQAIKDCCDYAAQKHVALVIKPHGGLNSTGEQCKKTVQKLAKKNFGLWYDPGNIYYYSAGKLDPAEDAKAVGGVVTGMCVKDFKPPKNVDVTPGDGQVKFEQVMAELRKGGFTSGPLVVETLGPVQEREQRIAEARKSRLFVEGILSALRS